MKQQPLFAWVTLMPDGRPSIVGMLIPETGQHFPMIGFSRAIIEPLRDLAQRHGKALGQPVYFVQFDSMEVLDEVRP